MKNVTRSSLFRVFMPLFLAVVLGGFAQVGYTHIANLYVDHNLIVGQDLTVTNDLAITNDLAVTGGLDVDGATTLNSELDVDGNVSSGTGSFTVTDTVNITDAVDLDSTLNVDGAVSSGTGSFTVTDSLVVTDTSDLQGNISNSTGELVITDNAGITGTLTVTGNTTLGGTLTFESVAMSGPLTFGAVSAVVTSTAIAHGLGTTPTVVLLTPQHSSDIFTNVVYVLISDTSTITVGLGYTGGVQTVDILHWMAGK